MTDSRPDLVGSVSADGGWVWNGAEWVPAAPGLEAPMAALPPRSRRRLAIALGALAGLVILTAGIGVAIAPRKALSLAVARSPSPQAGSTPSASPGTSPSASASSSAAPSSSATATAAAAQTPSASAFAVHITASTYGHVAATTAPGASCTAVAKMPSGSDNRAPGLTGTLTAGADGKVAWDYGKRPKVTKGQGTHTVTCSLNGKTASDSASFST